MKNTLFMILALSTCFMTACESKIDDLETTRLTSNIAVTEANGVVTGTVSSSATTDQIMVASTSSGIADSAVTFPPGALAVSTEIALGEAGDRKSAILAELGVVDALQSTAPVYVGPATGTPPVIGEALTIQLPLPLEETGTGLVNTAGTSKLVLVYVIYDNGWKAGMIPLTSENLSGAFVKQAMEGLGYFQIVYLNTAAAVKEVSSQVRPGLDGVSQGDK